MGSDQQATSRILVGVADMNKNPFEVWHVLNM
jgi:hypothetical protein